MLFLTASKADRHEGRPFAPGRPMAGAPGSSSRSSGPNRWATRSCPRRSASRRPSSSRPSAGSTRRRAGSMPMDRTTTGDPGRPVHARAGHRRGKSSEPAPPARWPALPDLRRPRPAVRHPARLSGDRGKTWSDSIVLRDDGGGHRRRLCPVDPPPDGKVVAVYYYNDRPAPRATSGRPSCDPGKP